MIPHATFRTCLGSALKAVARSSPLPILTHVRITTGADGLIITGTDQQMQTVARDPSPLNPIDVCVPADRLKSAIEALSGSLVLKSGAMLSIKGDRGMVKMPKLEPIDYPSIKYVGPVISSFPNEGVDDAMKRVRFAAATKDVRYYFVAIHLKADGEKMTVTTTNGNIIAQVTLPIACPAFEALVPTTSFAKVGEWDSAEVTKDCIRFIGKGAVSTLKLVDGKFPDANRLFQPTNKKLSFNRSQMSLAASVTGNLYESSLQKWVRIKQAEKLVAGVDEKGEGGLFDIDGEGDPIDMGVAIAYLTGILNSLTTDVVTMSWDGDKEFPHVTFYDGNYRVLAAPVRM